LEIRYPGKFQERYLRGKTISVTSAEELLEEAARTQGLLGKEGIPQVDNMARMILADFRQGRLGQISFEIPEASGEKNG
jgi:ribosome biogenesis GTPase A